jgi:uncharacterized peroxidase-related enzyme
VDAVARDWRDATFPAETAEADRALCAFAERLTISPAKMTEDDVESLRAAGLTDRDVHDATQVVAYFNDINRVADALGVDPEPDWSR